VEIPSSQTASPATRSLEPNLFLRAALAVLLGTLLLRVAGGVATGTLNFYLKSLGQVGLEVGFVAAGYYATELLLAPVFGALTDRIGRKALVVAAPVVGAIALLLYPLTSSLGVLFLIRVIEGISAAAAIPATLGYLSDLTDGSPHRARLMGLYEIVTLIGVTGGGIVLGPLLWSALGTSSYPFLAVVYVLGALVFAFLLPNIGVIVHKRRTVADYARALGNRRLVRFLPAWISATGVIGLWLVHVQNLLSRNTTAGEATVATSSQALVGAFTPPEVAKYLAWFAVAFLLGLYYWASRGKGDRRTTPMIYAGYGLLAIAVSWFFLNHPELGLNPLLSLPLVGVVNLWFVVLLIGAFFQAGFTPVALAYLADISEDFPEDRGVVMGLYSIFLAGGNLIGGSLLGGIFVTTLRMDGVILLTFLFTLLAFFSVLHIRRVSRD
jgi:MFS family permease